MVYRGCGHAVKPFVAPLSPNISQAPDISRAPKAVKEEDMPENCIICRAGVDGVLGEKLRVMRERQEMEEKVLEGLKVGLPGIFGGLCRSTGDSVDKRVEESREFWRREMEGVCAEVMEKERICW